MTPHSDFKHDIADLETLAHLLDSKFRGPFGFRFGWDGLIGLIPGLGDLATTVVSGYIVARAAMIGAGPALLVRMLSNILIDNLISAIPLVGWLGDFAWKSNARNLELVRHHHAAPAEAARRSRAWIWAVVGVLGVFTLALAVLSGWVIWKTFTWIASVW